MTHGLPPTYLTSLFHWFGIFTSHIPQELDVSGPKHAILFQAFKSDICNFFHMEFSYLPCPSRLSLVDYSLFCISFVSNKLVKIYYDFFGIFWILSFRCYPNKTLIRYVPNTKQSGNQQTFVE